MNKWILVGSLGAVFVITLMFSYGPGYGGRLSAFLGSNVTNSPEVSPSDTVTPVVTPKKVVTFSNVTTVSPTMSPLIYSDGQSSLMSPSMSPVPSRTPTMSPTPSVIHSVSPSRTPTPLVSPTPTPPPQTSTPSPTPSLTPIPTPIPDIPQSTKININTAGKTELMTLKGIKDVKSDAIVQYRELHGPFGKIEDIMNVSGIGPVTFDGIKDQITVEP